MDICNSRDRVKAAMTLPGGALCFAGVGYDEYDLVFHKRMSKINIEKISGENESLRKNEKK